jgi:hypothetical protein
VSSEVRSIDGDHGVVTGSRRNISVAVGAEIHLRGLIRLQKPDLELAEFLRIEHHVLPKRTQTTNNSAAAQPAAT